MLAAPVFLGDGGGDSDGQCPYYKVAAPDLLCSPPQRFKGFKGLYYGYIRVMLRLYRGYMEIMEKNLETTIMGYIGFKGFQRPWHLHGSVSA